MQNPGAFARASIEQKTTESKTLEKRTASRPVSGIRKCGTTGWEKHDQDEKGEFENG
jgi:hypothetical protein